MAFDPLKIFGTLHRHGVEFVLIGGLAGATHGSPTVTGDLDICYARSRANLEALARALTELNARPRGAPPNVPFVLDARTLANGDHFTFVTDAGDFDCLGTPAGTNGFEELRAGAVSMDFDDVIVAVASLDDLIRMKRASGRQKDLVEIEILGALREEIEAVDDGD